MDLLNTSKTWLDKIPEGIEFVRNLVISISEKVNLPSETHLLVFLVLAFYLAYLFIKQFITYSVFTKLSSLLNWILIGLLIYILFVYV